MSIINTAIATLYDILSHKKVDGEVRIGNRVREIRVKDADGNDSSFYRKDGTYHMSHAGTADVGEYESVQTDFPEYTSELQQEMADNEDTISGLIDEALAETETEETEVETTTEDTTEDEDYGSAEVAEEDDGGGELGFGEG